MKHVSLQTVVLVPFLVLTLVASVLVGYLSHRNGRSAVNEVAHQLRIEINARINDHLEQFLQVPRRINRINATAFEHGDPDVDDQTALLQRFHEQVRLFESITSVNFGNAHGGLANAGREGAGEDYYVIVTEPFTRGALHKYAIDNGGRRGELLDEVPHFDARERPWYSEAVKQGSAVWSDVYILATGQDLSFSASRPVYGASGDLLGVTGVNLFFSHTVDFLATLEIGKTGQSFIMERSGLLIASSTEEALFTTDEESVPQDRVLATESTSPQTRGAARALLDQYGDLAAIDTPTEFLFELEGERAFGRVNPFRDGSGLDWLVVTVIPEADFMAPIRESDRAAVLLTFVMLAVISGVGVLIARKITRPVAQLTASTTKIAEATRAPEESWPEITYPNSVVQEITTLSHTFAGMVERLRETVAGLTRENRERRRAEDALERLNAQLETKNRELEQVVYVASHDLRSPLVNIDGYSREIAYALEEIHPILSSPETKTVPELLSLLKTPLNDMASALPYIRSSTTQMDALLSGLLHLSRSGRAALQIGSLEMNSLVQELVASLEFPRRESQAKITVEDLPPCRGDEIQIKQVFANLVGNAIKYLDPERAGVIRIRGWIQDNRAIYSVEDNGIGIAPDHQKHIFEVFHQLEPRTSAGEGLGLAIARQILIRLDGEIWVESQTGEGACFFVALPTATEEQR